MRDQTLEFQKLREAVISAQMQTGATLAAEWVYEDEDGLEAFRVLELESEDDHRRHVRMVWPELDGPRWFMGEPKRPWPLYGLMELSVGQRVYVCQSESAAAEARRAGLAAVAEARRAGLAAVAVAHGPNGREKTDFSPLSGRDVVILPDNRIVDGAVAWEPGAVNVAADGVLLSGRRRRKPGPPADKQAEAGRWLLARLSTGPVYIGHASDAVESQTLRGELTAAGFSYATLRQAFAAVHAVSERCASTGRYRWRLASATESAESSRVGPGPGGG